MSGVFRLGHLLFFIISTEYHYERKDQSHDVIPTVQPHSKLVLDSLKKCPKRLVPDDTLEVNPRQFILVRRVILNL